MSNHGSLLNHLMSGARPAHAPAVGDGATEICWSDRHAYTVIEVRSRTTIVVQQDRAIRTDNLGPCDCQSYRYEPNPEGLTRVLTLRSNGRWAPKGQPSNGPTFLLGARDEHHDYGF